MTCQPKPYMGLAYTYTLRWFEGVNIGIYSIHGVLGSGQKRTHMHGENNSIEVAPMVEDIGRKFSRSTSSTSPAKGRVAVDP